MSKQGTLFATIAGTLALIVALTAIAWAMTAGDDDPTTAPPAKPKPEAPAKVAARVVEATYSFDYKTPGPNTWIDTVRSDLTEDAYAFYRQTLGPGDGQTDTPFWQELVATSGHQRVTTGGIHPDPAAKATNTDTHLTLLVPFEVDAAGIDSDLAHGDRIFFVNLDRPTPADAWKVASVMPTAGLMDDYATDALTPIR